MDLRRKTFLDPLFIETEGEGIEAKVIRVVTKLWVDPGEYKKNPLNTMDILKETRRPEKDHQLPTLSSTSETSSKTTTKLVPGTSSRPKLYSTEIL